MSSTNRTIRVFIPFLKATMQVLQELTQKAFMKRNVYTHVGNLNGTDYQVEIGIIGDIRSRVIFSFPKPFAKELTRIMLNIGEEDVDPEFVEGSIQEIGNMVSGNAMGLLEEIGLSADITPPKLYFPGEKVVGDQAQMGVLEFTSDIGSFHVAIVTNENNSVVKNDVVVSIGFPRDMDLALAKFLFTKGIYLLGANDKNLSQIFSNYTPSLIILNTQNSEFQMYIDQLSQIDNIHDVPIAIFGDASEYNVPDNSLSSIIEVDTVADSYDFLEKLKEVLHQAQISIYDNRENIVIKVPKNSDYSAFFLVNTRRGERETIPIVELSFDNLVIDISNHQYINFPERKNLNFKNDPQIQLGKLGAMRLEKIQIGKSLSDDLVVVSIRHILETENQKLTTYMYDVLSL